MENKLFKLKYNKVGFDEYWDYHSINNYIFHLNLVIKFKFRRINADKFGIMLEIKKR